MTMRLLFLLALLICGCEPASSDPRHGSFITLQPGWQTLKIGGGGYVTGIDMSPDGTTRVVRTDTYGDYIWNATTDKWEQMLTVQSLGYTDTSWLGQGRYTYEISVAPSLATRLYRYTGFGYIQRSDDRGATWSLTNFTQTLETVTQGGLAAAARLRARRMAVDPQNPDVLIVGSTVNGNFMTVDGGTSWTDLKSQVPPASVNRYKVNGNHSIGATTIAVDTGTAGIPACVGTTCISFQNDSVTQYSVTVGLASGSGNITISPALNTAVSDDTWVLSPLASFIAYDPSSSVVGGKKQGAAIASYGSGLYFTSDAGATWTRNDNAVDTFFSIRYASDGTMYVLGITNLYRCDSIPCTSASTFTSKSTGTWITVNPDPNDPNRVVLQGSLLLRTSNNKGDTFAQTSASFWPPVCQPPTPGVSSGERRASAAPDAPWLAWTNECTPATSDSMFDPVVPNRLWLVQGIGVWYYDFASSSSIPTSQITWTAQTRGIENLVSNYIIKTPGSGNFVNYFAWDRPQFYLNLGQYPSTQGPNAFCAINHAWNGDYASSDPNFLVMITNGGTCAGAVQYSGYSVNGGSSWYTFLSRPANTTIGWGGSIAASTPQNFLYCPSNQRNPSYSLNGGASWTAITSAQIPGLAADGGNTGWGFAYYLNIKACAADRVNANTFYMYNYLTVAPGGFYRSSDSGATWTKIYDTSVLLCPTCSAINGKLKAVPGYAGHLFYAFGPQGNGTAPQGGLYRSTDAATAGAGAQTWQTIAGITGVLTFGYGAAAPGYDYPTVYMSGWYNNGSGETYGIWRGVGTLAQWNATNGSAVTWTNIAASTYGAPLGIMDLPRAMEGDPDLYGRVFIGYGGIGAVFYQPSANESYP